MTRKEKERRMGAASALAALLVWGASPSFVGGIAAPDGLVATRAECGGAWVHLSSSSLGSRTPRIELLEKSCMWDKERGSRSSSFSSLEQPSLL